jgi:hypothetical protein
MIAARACSRGVAAGFDGDHGSRTGYSVIEMLCLQMQKQQTLNSLFLILLPLQKLKQCFGTLSFCLRFPKVVAEKSRDFVFELVIA